MKRDIFRLSVLLAFVIAGFSACQDEMDGYGMENYEAESTSAIILSPEGSQINNIDSEPISNADVTPFTIEGYSEGANGGNRTCGDVAYAFEATFQLSTARVNYDNGEFDAEWPAGLNVSVDVVDGVELVSFSMEAPLVIDGKCYIVAAVIVKGGSGTDGIYRSANIYYYGEDGIMTDSGLGTPTGQDLSNLTFCFIKVECEEECEWIGETAWSFGPRYVNRGNWATYTPYGGVEETVTLFAGQTMEAGTVNFSAPDDRNVTITITLNSGWRFADVEENVKIQDYTIAPTENPSPGLFDHKGDATESPFVIVVPLNDFYGVHVDVEWYTCPDDL